MSKNYLSIEISDIRINFVEGRQEGNEIHIEKMFFIPNNHGFIRNGEIIDPVAIGKLVKTALRKNKVKAKKAIVNISPKQVMVKEKTIDKVADNVVNDMIKVELLGDDINLEEYEMQLTIDYSNENVEELTMDVKVHLMPRKHVEDIRNILKFAGLVDLYLDLTNNSLYKLHRHILKANNFNDEYSITEREDATIMYLDLSNESVQVNIFKGYHLELYRSQDNMVFDYLFSHENVDVETLDKFIDSIELTSRYYKSTQVGNYIDEVFFYGFNEKHQNLDYVTEQLGDKLSTNVNPLVHLNGIITGNIDENSDISCYLNAISALIRLEEG